MKPIWKSNPNSSKRELSTSSIAPASRKRWHTATKPSIKNLSSKKKARSRTRELARSITNPLRRSLKTNLPTRRRMHIKATSRGKAPDLSDNPSNPTGLAPKGASNHEAKIIKPWAQPLQLQFLIKQKRRSLSKSKHRQDFTESAAPKAADS